MELGRISRRHFLYGSAVLAGSVALASCTSGGGGETNNGGGTEGSKAVGSSSEPLAVPGKYQCAEIHKMACGLGRDRPIADQASV